MKYQKPRDDLRKAKLLTPLLPKFKDRFPATLCKLPHQYSEVEQKEASIEWIPLSLLLQSSTYNLRQKKKYPTLSTEPLIFDYPIHGEVQSFNYKCLSLKLISGLPDRQNCHPSPWPSLAFETSLLTMVAQKLPLSIFLVTSNQAKSPLYGCLLSRGISNQLVENAKEGMSNFRQT